MWGVRINYSIYRHSMTPQRQLLGSALKLSRSRSATRMCAQRLNAFVPPTFRLFTSYTDTPHAPLQQSILRSEYYRVSTRTTTEASCTHRHHPTILNIQYVSVCVCVCLMGKLLSVFLCLAVGNAPYMCVWFARAACDLCSNGGFACAVWHAGVSPEGNLIKFSRARVDAATNRDPIY